MVDKLFTASHHAHMLSVVLLILAQFWYFSFKNESDFIRFYRKIGIMLLVQNVFLGMVIFTGLLMLAVTKFLVWNLEIVLMIFLAVGIIVHQILINKRRKGITTTDTTAQEAYKAWVAKVMGAEIGAEIVVYASALVLH